MSITYGNANYRKKFDAFRIVAECGHEPLKEAILCALRLRNNANLLEKALGDAKKPETRAQVAIALHRAIPDELTAWLKIAEFIYAKPKQQIEMTGNVTLEQVLAASNGVIVPTIQEAG